MNDKVTNRFQKLMEKLGKLAALYHYDAVRQQRKSSPAQRRRKATRNNEKHVLGICVGRRYTTDDAMAFVQQHPGYRMRRCPRCHTNHVYLASSLKPRKPLPNGRAALIVRQKKARPALTRTIT